MVERQTQNSGARAGPWWVRPAAFGALAALVLAAAAWAALNFMGDETTEVSSAGDAPTTVAGSAEPTASTTVPAAESTDPPSPTTNPNPTVAGQVAGESALPANGPNSFFAVQLETFDLVEVRTHTGEILHNFGGWGPLGLDDDGAGQALQTVAVGPAGTLYVDDCCEPAFGSAFALEPPQEFAPDQLSRFEGVAPKISPNGQLIALSRGPSTGVATTLGVDLSTIESPDGEGASMIPLAWISDRILAVRALGDLADSVVFFDLADPSNPVEIEGTSRNAPGKLHLAAATRADGMLLAAVLRFSPDGSVDDGDMWGEVIDPATGEVVAEFDLPDGVNWINYDSSGTFLITSDDEGNVRWFGAGLSGSLGNGYIGVAWH